MADCTSKPRGSFPTSSSPGEGGKGALLSKIPLLYAGSRVVNFRSIKVETEVGNRECEQSAITSTTSLPYFSEPWEAILRLGF